MASCEVSQRLQDQTQMPEKTHETFRESSSLVLSEEQALAKARTAPNEALPILITYGFNDRDNPRNWPKARKWYITCLASLLNVFTTWCAGGISSGATGIQEEFGVAAEVTTLCLSLYVLGYAIGPVLLAPLSEYFGRQPVYAVSWFLLFIFSCRLHWLQISGQF